MENTIETKIIIADLLLLADLVRRGCKLIEKKCIGIAFDKLGGNQSADIIGTAYAQCLVDQYEAYREEYDHRKMLVEILNHPFTPELPVIITCRKGHDTLPLLKALLALNDRSGLHDNRADIAYRLIVLAARLQKQYDIYWL